MTARRRRRVVARYPDHTWTVVNGCRVYLGQ
jgi:hypothetical protein